MSKDFPRPLAPISVNVDEWLQRSSIPAPSLEEIRTSLGQTSDFLIKAEEARARESKLEGPSRECGECGHTERHYVNDYICYKCRDQRED